MLTQIRFVSISCEIATIWQLASTVSWCFNFDRLYEFQLGDKWKNWGNSNL